MRVEVLLDQLLQKIFLNLKMKEQKATEEKSFIRKTSNRIKETLLGQKREKKNILQPLFIPEEVVKLGEPDPDIPKN